MNRKRRLALLAFIMLLSPCSNLFEKLGTAAHRRHDISDTLWEKLEPHLPCRKGGMGSMKVLKAEEGIPITVPRNILTKKKDKLAKTAIIHGVKLLIKTAQVIFITMKQHLKF